MTRTALIGARIFDGERFHEGAALVVADGLVEGIVPERDVDAAERVVLGGGVLAPGFIDLQVNGGGGAQFDLDPTVESIRTICSTFSRYGTTACLPTLVTSPPDVTRTALAAGAEAARQEVDGFLGLHLEGPHLSIARKGAHDPALIRPMDPDDLTTLTGARRDLPNLLTTVAAETVTPEQIAQLAAAGIVVSVGHSDAGYDAVRAAVEAGATLVTHLFNAQSQLGNRDPGVVGAALATASVHAGLIADGIHVHPESIGIALRAKRGPGRIFLITDAMSVTGTDATSFELTGRTVYRKDGALRLGDGTLAGADLTMIDAVRYTYHTLGLPLEEALRMAALYPAEALGVANERGRLATGLRADLVHLGNELNVRTTVIGGRTVWNG